MDIRQQILSVSIKTGVDPPTLEEDDTCTVIDLNSREQILKSCSFSTQFQGEE